MQQQIEPAVFWALMAFALGGTLFYGLAHLFHEWAQAPRHRDTLRRWRLI